MGSASCTKLVHSIPFEIRGEPSPACGRILYSDNAESRQGFKSSHARSTLVLSVYSRMAKPPAPCPRPLQLASAYGQSHDHNYIESGTLHLTRNSLSRETVDNFNGPSPSIVYVQVGKGPLFKHEPQQFLYLST